MTSAIRAIDIAAVNYQVTDLDVAETFMTAFGLSSALRSDDMLYMRGAGTTPYLYSAARGDTNVFLGLAFRVAGRAELEALARLPGSGAVEPLLTPGGGWRVRMYTPDGIAIDAVCDAQPAAVLPHRGSHPFNAGDRKARRNQSLRPRREPGTVLRLGHVVLHVSNHDQTVAWLTERLGFIPSDFFCAPGADGSNGKVYGSFLRIDRGDEFVDHHCLLVLQSEDVGVHHCAFEVQDLDAVMGAHDYLLEQGYRLDCGVGRHLLGSQIFDYWRDPFGFRVEHYTDGDVVNSGHAAGYFSGTADETTQWGAKPTPDFFE